MDLITDLFKWLIDLFRGKTDAEKRAIIDKIKEGQQPAPVPVPVPEPAPMTPTTPAPIPQNAPVVVDDPQKPGNIGWPLPEKHIRGNLRANVSNFDKDLPADWGRQLNDYGIVIENIAGRKMAKFEMRAENKGVIRSELRCSLDIEKEERFGYTLYFPKEDWNDNDKAWAIVGQWHSLEDKHLKEEALPPPISMWIVNGRWGVTVRWDHDKVTTPTTDQEKTYDLGPLPVDEMLDIIWFVRYSNDTSTDKNNKEAGAILLSVNNTRVLEHRGPNTYNDQVKYPYFKIGIYKRQFPAGKRKRVYLGPLRIGNSKSVWQDVQP